MDVSRLVAFCDAWLQRDLDALASYLAQDVVYRPAGPPAQEHRGRAQVLDAFAAALAQSDPADRLVFHSARVDGSRGTIEWRLEPAGGAGTTVGVDLLEFEGDLIAVKDVFAKPAGGAVV